MTATVSTFFILRRMLKSQKVSGREIYLVNTSKWKVERLLYLNWILHLPPMTPRTPQTGVGHNWSCPGHGETSEKVQLVQNTVFFSRKKSSEPHPQAHCPCLWAVGIGSRQRIMTRNVEELRFETSEFSFGWFISTHLWILGPVSIPVVCLQPNRYKNTFRGRSQLPKRASCSKYTAKVAWSTKEMDWLSKLGLLLTRPNGSKGAACIGKWPGMDSDQSVSRSVLLFTMTYYAIHLTHRCCWRLPIF